jgi:hypothetical protein
MRKKRSGRKRFRRRGPRKEFPLWPPSFSIYEDLSDAICLLKLIGDREPEPSENLSSNAESPGYDRERNEDGDRVEVEPEGLEELDIVGRQEISTISQAPIWHRHGSSLSQNLGPKFDMTSCQVSQ